MKQLNVKAVQLLMEIEGNSNVTIEDHDYENIKAAIILLLKEQDRDTRHACAEKVNELAMDNKTITYAHNVIMNTKGFNP
ncbi:hypothetical protein KAR91_49435 [Candidatus Pacearchaeota archaeon]|nr:hypothetical protein [Candidatus Pacearchaeota archaeon]